MLQSEYREVGKNFNLITDIGFTKGYKSSVDNKKNLNHIFADLDLDLDLTSFNESDLSIKIESFK